MRIEVDAGKVVAPLEPFWAGQCNPMIETGADGNRPLCAYLADVGIRYWRADIWGGRPEHWPEQDRTAEAVLAAGARPIVIVGARCLVTSYSGFRKPLINAYGLLDKLGSQRVRLTSSVTERTISGIATRGEDGSVQVMLVRFSGDPYEAGDETAVELTIDNLPMTGEVTVEHYRIDHAHSNAHAAWVAQGSPYRPTPKQAAAIRERESLELIEPACVERLDGETFATQISLPPCSVSLIVLSP